MLTRFQLAKQSEITATWVRDIAQWERVPILVLTRRFQLAKQSETTATWTGIQTVQRYSTSFVLSRFGSKLKVKHRPAKHNETIVTWGRDTVQHCIRVNPGQFQPGGTIMTRGRDTDQWYIGRFQPVR